MPIASLTTSEAEVADIGVEAACGHITASPYFQSVDTETNHDFVRKYHAMFGTQQSTNACCESAYFQVHMFANALRMVGKLDTESIRASVLENVFDAPQGKIKIDKDNNHTFLWPKIGCVNQSGQFDIIEQADTWVKPDPYLVNLQMNNSMFTVGSTYHPGHESDTRH